MHEAGRTGDVAASDDGEPPGSWAELPELHPRRDGDRAGCSAAVEGETPAGLPPLKPPGKTGQRDSQHQQAQHDGRARSTRSWWQRRRRGERVGRHDGGLGCGAGRPLPRGTRRPDEPQCILPRSSLPSFTPAGARECPTHSTPIAKRSWWKAARSGPTNTRIGRPPTNPARRPCCTRAHVRRPTWT
ncbi:MAG: hypothetical protein ACK559_38365, partial [bacterium]